VRQARERVHGSSSFNLLVSEIIRLTHRRVNPPIG
jgi:hypothetical protein